jgi:signal transduction histidine kinase
MCKDEVLCRNIDETQAVAAHIDRDVDFLAWELRPTVLDDIGLAAALADYVREWAAHFGMRADFTSNRFGKKRLAPEAETNLYRIVQEALNNIYKHAQAENVNIILQSRENYAVLIIEDDGIGFEHENQIITGKAGKGMGLIGMYERAALVGGTLEIESVKGEGTTIYVRVPLSTGRKKQKEVITNR